MDQKQIPGAIIIAALIIGGAILLKDSSTTPTTGSNQAVSAEVSKIRPIGDNEHLVGNANAKVVVVEYSDTECPFCKRFHNTMNEVIKQKGNEVAWAYRHFPIPSLHKKAFHEAEATECAWDQGGNNAFWQYTNELYARTGSNDKLDVAELPKIASSIGLDVAAFNSCLESGKYKAKVQADIDNGTAMDVRGTPFSVILKNGKVVGTIPGALPIEEVLAEINKALK